MKGVATDAAAFEPLAAAALTPKLPPLTVGTVIFGALVPPDIAGILASTEDPETDGCETDGSEIFETLGRNGTALYAPMSRFIPLIAPVISPLITLMTEAITSITPPAIFPTTVRAPPSTVLSTGAT